MFEFVKSLRSSGAATPVKYKCDIPKVKGVLMILKYWKNNGKQERLAK